MVIVDKYKILLFLGYHKFDVIVKLVYEVRTITKGYFNEIEDLGKDTYYVLNPSDEFIMNPIIYCDYDEYNERETLILKDINGKFNKFESATKEDDFKFNWYRIMECVDKFSSINIEPYKEHIFNKPTHGNFFLLYDGDSAKIKVRTKSFVSNGIQTFTETDEYVSLHNFPSFYRSRYDSTFELYSQIIIQFIFWLNNNK